MGHPQVSVPKLPGERGNENQWDRVFGEMSERSANVTGARFGVGRPTARTVLGGFPVLQLVQSHQGHLSHQPSSQNSIQVILLA